MHNDAYRRLFPLLVRLRPVIIARKSALTKTYRARGSPLMGLQARAAHAEPPNFDRTRPSGEARGRGRRHCRTTLGIVRVRRSTWKGAFSSI